MYQPNFEYLVELRRKEILDETKQARLEKASLSLAPYRPGLFAHAMFDLANWMIATGKQLRRRYEVPTVSCNHSTHGSFAH